MQKRILQHAYQYHMSCLKRWQNELEKLVAENVKLGDSRMLEISRKCDYHTNQIYKIAGQLAEKMGAE